MGRKFPQVEDLGRAHLPIHTAAGAPPSMIALTLSDVHASHLAALRRQRRRPATLSSYGMYVGGFLKYLDTRSMGALHHLTPELVGDYQDWIRAHSTGSRGGAAAERHAVRLLKAFSRWAWRRQIYVSDPLARLEPPRLPKLHRQPFTEAECHRLMAAAQSSPDAALTRALLLVGLDTGCRIGELLAAELADLDLDAGSILFRTTKTMRVRRVFFRVARMMDGGPCVVALRAWLAIRPSTTSTTIFVGRSGQPLSTDQARRMYRALGRTAHVANAHPHRARHTAASEFLTELPGAELHLRNRLGQVSAAVLADYVTIGDASARVVAESASLSAKWTL